MRHERPCWVIKERDIQGLRLIGGGVPWVFGPATPIRPAQSSVCSSYILYSQHTRRQSIAGYSHYYSLSSRLKSLNAINLHADLGMHYKFIGYVETKEIFGLPMVMAMARDVEIADTLIAEA